MTTTTEEKKALALTALSLMDLTSLNDDDTEDTINALCRKAQTPFGNVAAVCVYPRFVALAREQLKGTGIRVATVINFPHADESLEAIKASTEKAVQDGADEIDVVVPFAAANAGDLRTVLDIIDCTRYAMVDASPHMHKTLKVILETAALKTLEIIRETAGTVIWGGADFIKTSTGKLSKADAVDPKQTGATLAAAEIMMQEIKYMCCGVAHRKFVGFKASGGVRTAEDAAAYLAIWDRIMGPGAATPENFRFGASGLLDNLLAVLNPQAPAPSRPAALTY